MHKVEKYHLYNNFFKEAGHLVSGLDWEGAVKDIEGAAKYLKELGCIKIGVTGFCMGGALAIASISFTN